VSPLLLLKLAKALAHLKPPPRGRNGSPEFLRPARGLLTVVLPSLLVDSWPFPRHRVRRGTLFLSAQLRRPQSHPSPRQPQLRRPHRRGEEQCRPQPSVPPGLIPSVRFRSHGPDRGYRFAHAPPGAGSARSAHSPPLSLTLPGPPVSARPLARAPSAADLISAVGFRSDG
jgi:hypothetical protein